MAHLRPQLWSEYLTADALAAEITTDEVLADDAPDEEASTSDKVDDETLNSNGLRARLAREVARRVAKLANERARLAFEQTEELPFPDPTRQKRLDELANQIALESLRARWLECARTSAGIKQLRAIENAPLHASHAAVAARPTWAKTTLSLTVEFGDKAANSGEVSAFIGECLQREGALWGATLTPVRVCYNGKTGPREEAGVEIGLISDPRNPLDAHELAHRAFQLADRARERFGQHRLCISFPDCVVMLESAGAPLP